MTLYKMTQLLRLSLYRMTVHGCPEYGPASRTNARRLTKNSVRADNRSGGVYPRKITGGVLPTIHVSGTRLAPSNPSFSTAVSGHVTAGGGFPHFKLPNHFLRRPPRAPPR